MPKSDFDKELAHSASRHLRPGEWATYGAIAALSGTREKGYGSHVKTCAEPDTGEHRVLLQGGVPAGGFRWVAEPWRRGVQSQLEALEAEGLEFYDGRADHSREVTIDGLRTRLAESAALVESTPAAMSAQGLSVARQVPLERTHAAQYIAQPVSPNDAIRRREEATLVNDFADWVKHRYEVVLRRWELPTAEAGPPLLTDAYWPGRHLLIEAKAGAGRLHVRMALGQLLDYRRYVPAPPPALAVLLPVAPSHDMAVLLAEHEVGVINRHGDGFAGDGLTDRGRLRSSTQDVGIETRRRAPAAEPT